jgi:hypothetical protein
MNDEQNLLVLVVIGMSVNALIGFGLGKLRGQPGSGVVLAAVLGPIGWLCIFALADQRGRCRECRGLVRSGARVCQHCGRELIITWAG